MLHSRLSNLKVPENILKCCDVNCEIESHNEACDAFLLDILFSVIESSHLAIPFTGQNKGKRKYNDIPGWSTEIRPLREYSKQCYIK